MWTSTTVGSTNVSSLFRQTPDLISLSDSLLFLGKFCICFFFRGIFIDFPSPTVHHCLTERTKQPMSILLPPSLSPPPLKTAFHATENTESTRCQSSSFVRLLKRNEAVPPHLFEVQLIISLLTGSLSIWTVWNVRVFRGLSRMAVYKLNKLATDAEVSLSLSVAVCWQSNFFFFWKRRQIIEIRVDWRVNEWTTQGFFCFIPFYFCV